MLSRRLVSRSLAPAPKGSAPWRRRWLYAAVGVIALAASVAVPVLPAAADTGNIAFDAVSGDGSGNLTVTITSDDPLGSIVVHLWSGGSDTGTDVLDVTDFVEQGSFVDGSTPQTWVLNTPATDLAALQPGAYTATLDVTDADADQTVTDLSPTGQNTFDFRAKPTLTLSSLSSTQPNQSVSATGQLTGCAALSCPSPGWPVGTPVTVTDITSSGQPTWQGATTDAGGDFQVPGVTAIPGDSYTASVAATSTNLAGTSSAVQDTAVYATTSIQATATQAPFGHQIISGTLTYQSGLNQVPAPSGVTITFDAQGQPELSTTTSANGTFSKMLPAVPGTTIWTLSSQVNDQATNPFLAGTQESISATQTPWTASISGFSATLNKYYTLTVGGCLSTNTQPPPPADFPTIQIQYETTTAGPWHTLGYVGTTTMTGCPGVAFVAAGGAPAASAYYRANFLGDDIYTPATGPSVKAALIATRFGSFKASPKSVAAGRNVTISGTLQYHTNKWHAYGRQRVLLIFAKHKNARVYYSFKWLTTTKKGTFSKTFADNLGTQWWSANYNGNKTHLVSGAPPVHVMVHGRATARPGATGPPTGSAQLATPLFGTMHGQASWHSVGWPFLMAAEPLLILMGRQA